MRPCFGSVGVAPFFRTKGQFASLPPGNRWEMQKADGSIQGTFAGLPDGSTTTVNGTNPSEHVMLSSSGGQPLDRGYRGNGSLAGRDTDKFDYNIIEDPVHGHDFQAAVRDCPGVDHRRLADRFQRRDFRLTDLRGRMVLQPLAWNRLMPSNRMHLLLVHKEFPGHYGHVARYLVQHEDVECTFVYNRIPDRYMGRIPPGSDQGLRLIPYQTRGASRETHPCNLHTEISSWHAHAVYQTLKARPEIRPDVVIGHSVYGTALYLPQLYHCPLVVHCEFFERPGKPYAFGRPEFPPSESDLLCSWAQNATNLLNLQACTAGYSPTHWQRSLFPTEYQPRIATIFDGIDRTFWYRRPVPRRVGQVTIPEGTRVVTYCSYGLEALRGFDIFMRMARRISEARRDVLFVVVGADRAYYGNDARHLQGSSFAQHVLRQERYDLSRFIFLGQIREEDLVQILSLSDLHVYLTMPFVASWSLFDALACGCIVLGSDTAPVREILEHEKTGLLADFFDVDGLTRQALRVLDDPVQYRPLAEAGVRLVDEKYSLERTAPQVLELCRRAVRGERPAGMRGDPVTPPHGP